MVNVLKYCTPHKVSDKMTYADSADTDQTATEQSDQGLHNLPFY